MSAGVAHVTSCAVLSSTHTPEGSFDLLRDVVMATRPSGHAAKLLRLVGVIATSVFLEIFMFFSCFSSVETNSRLSMAEGGRQHGWIVTTDIREQISQ